MKLWAYGDFGCCSPNILATTKELLFDTLGYKTDSIEEVEVIGLNDNVWEVVVDNAVRWCSNILVELLSNYGKYMKNEKREQLKNAVVSLGQYQTPMKDK